MLKQNLIGKIIPIKELMQCDKEAMYQLMIKYYNGVHEENFYTDLYEKQDVILLLDATTKIIKGFSTLVLLKAKIKGQLVLSLYSGDTIIDPVYWGSPQLALMWCKYVHFLMKTYPDNQLFWFLISKGFRTYRFLSVFFRDFYPHYNKTIPAYELEIMHTFAKSKFSDFNTTTGLIQSSKDKDRLKPGIGEIDDQKLKDPHIHYFQKCNPHWKRGDELVCITAITLENFTKMAKRLFIRANSTLDMQNLQGESNV